eukprot:TRINITY_DN37162_c0_g2_i1.p1 TRINITY_DN37162_c0_g2~~TRINITY_DN37162_c0_g2_i1.p1  ORF type:complete len:340 (-),score=45.01 TRINITY_DN37162_c0_g2_i1:51-1070(-)
MGLRGICSVAVLILAAGFVPFVRWAVPRLIHRKLQPPASQRKWQPKILPSVRSNEVRGKPVSQFVTDARIDFLEHNFTHIPGDVWVTTYLKVGTTWTQYIVTQLLGYPLVTSNFGLAEISPWPEMAHGPDAPSEEDLQTSVWSKGLPRVLKSHWPHADYMETLPNSSKVIYVYRKVDRVVESYWHHILDKFCGYWIEPEELPWDTFFEKFITGDLCFGDYFEHVASWWKVRDAPNVLFVRYEDLKNEPKATMARIAAFLEVDVGDSDLDKVLEATSLKSMKRWSDAPFDKFLKFAGAWRGDHIRGGKDEKLLTETQRTRLQERFKTVLQPLGVPYEHFF